MTLFRWLFDEVNATPEKSQKGNGVACWAHNQTRGYGVRACTSWKKYILDVKVKIDFKESDVIKK
jgi:hypothetical protein